MHEPRIQVEVASAQLDRLPDPAAALGEYPAKLSPAEGSAIWMQYLTAYGALIAVAHMAKGDFVVIPAASSSVGIAAMQMARAERAISIATTRKSNKKAELLSLGADHVIALGGDVRTAAAAANRLAGDVVSRVGGR